MKHWSYWRSALAAGVSAGLLGLPVPDAHAGATGKLLVNEAQIAKLVRHGPWPPPLTPDSSNRVSGSSSAVELGSRLFFDPRLSRNGKISCSSCHDPELGWTDGESRAGGLARLDRNTQLLFNVRFNRWFGWDGRTDSLWAHSIGPLLAEAKMGMTPSAVAALVRNDKAIGELYGATYLRSPGDVSAEEVLVDVAKALAAFQETMVSGRTAFDDFRDALARRDFDAARKYPEPAQRGAAIFVGRGKCNFCHVGARFTNDEFDDAGVPYFTGPGRVDRGRYEGINRLKASPFNRLGRYNDATPHTDGWATRQVAQTHRTFGQFKVPSLRQLSFTAPYMHNGSIDTLEGVVRHYSNINLERIHSDGARILKPLKLSDAKIQDVVEFLRTLSVQRHAAPQGPSTRNSFCDHTLMLRSSKIQVVRS